MEPGIYGTDGTDPEEASGVLEPEDSLDGTAGVRDVLDTGWAPAQPPRGRHRRGARRARRRLVAGRAPVGRRRLGDDGGRGGRGGEPRRPARPRAARPVG